MAARHSDQQVKFLRKAVRGRNPLTFPVTIQETRIHTRFLAQRAQLQMRAQTPAAPPSAATPHQSRLQHAQQLRPFPMSVPTPTGSRLASHGPPGTHGNSSAVPTERRFIIPSTPSNRFFPPRSTAGIVVGTPRVGYSNSGGSSTRAPFVPGTA
jgi:hypothetical protein